jgi:hypothetical protein
MGKFLVSKSKEKFTKSSCLCDFCMETHSMVNKWNSFKPKTNLQKRMKSVVSKIEKKYN